jgi:hypothetical protein
MGSDAVRRWPRAGPCWTVAFIGLFLAGSPAWAVKTDVVVLGNGDHLTGEVQQLERGRLALKTDDMGTLQIEWDKVRSVTAVGQFDIEDLDGSRHVGSLAAAAAGELRILTAPGTTVVRMLDVVAIHRVDATLWRRLDGSLDVGTSYTSASQLFTLDASAKVGTYRPGYEISASASAAVTTQPDAEDTSRSTTSLAYGRRFEGRWVALTKGQLEQNSELGFDLRSSLMTGGGRYLVQRRSDRLLAGLGASVNRERPVEGESVTNVEATLVLGYDRFAYDFPKVDISVTAAGFLSLSESGRERFELQARAQRELVKDFYATLRGYESYDSQPATEGALRNDWGLTFALGWSF